MKTESPIRYDSRKLLAPLSPEAPSGELLRYEGAYDQIREARRRDDPNLTTGVWERELKEADWGRVSEICLDCLENRTKDLQIAAWLMEAWLHLDGFAGAHEGLALIGKLCRTFWATMHPSLEDPEYRVLIFQWINEKLSLQLKFVPITSPPEVANLPCCCFWDWETASRAAHNRASGSANEGPSEKSEITTAKFQQSVELTPPDFLNSLARDLVSLDSAAAELEAFLDQQYGKEAPGLGKFHEIVGAIQFLISQFVPGQKVEPPAPPPPAVGTGQEDVPLQEAPPPQPSPSLPPIRSRAEAYQRLGEAADYLFRTEPHSPAPYLVRKAIAWGNMPLDELLPELVRNESALQEAMKLLKIEPSKRSGSESEK